jgi:hypothetical protein
VAASHENGIPLDYARPGFPRVVAKSRLRLGVISLSVSLLTALVTILSGSIIEYFKFPGSIQNVILEIMLPVALLALVLGIGGLFQRSGRNAAICGIILSIMEFVIIPAFHTA